MSTVQVIGAAGFSGAQLAALVAVRLDGLLQGARRSDAAFITDTRGQWAEDFILTVAVIEAWEKKHGRIPAGNWVFLRTDWSKRSGADYANVKEDGAHTPGPDPDAVRFLVEQRDVIGFGVETIGTDAGQAHGFTPPYPAHFYMHGKGRFGLNLVSGWNLDEFAMFGATMREHDARYEYSTEWTEIIKRIWSDEKPFDYKGKFFDIVATMDDVISLGVGEPDRRPSHQGPSGTRASVIVPYCFGSR